MRGSPLAVALALAIPLALAGAAEAEAQQAEPDPAGEPPPPRRTAEGLVAGPGGLRIVAFGQPAELVVATLTAVFGEPDADTGWGPAVASPFGVCPGERARGVRWGRLGVLLSDGPTSYGSAEYPHFFAWDVHAFEAESGLAPRTAAGIGLGSTVDALTEAYGERVHFHPADGPFPDRFEVAIGMRGSISGSLTGPDPDDTITFLTAGDPCGE